MRISAVETRVYRYPFDPPFRAAWDPVPRAHQDATIVVVRSDDGAEGYASGDGLPDRELLASLLVGRELGAADVHDVIETVDFHHGRNWTLELAVWDLLGRAAGEPVWRLLGGTGDRIGAYASSGELVSADDDGIAVAVGGGELRVRYADIASARTVVDWDAELKRSTR